LRVSHQHTYNTRAKSNQTKPLTASSIPPFEPTFPLTPTRLQLLKDLEEESQYKLTQRRKRLLKELEKQTKTITDQSTPEELSDSKQPRQMNRDYHSLPLFTITTETSWESWD
jgi:hypothetical protein